MKDKCVKWTNILVFELNGVRFRKRKLGKLIHALQDLNSFIVRAYNLKKEYIELIDSALSVRNAQNKENVKWG